MRVGGSREAGGEVNEGGDEGIRVVPGVHHIAVPDGRSREGFHVKSSDDAEVVGAALEHPEQVGAAAPVGLDDAPVGQHHLVVDDLIAGKPHAARVESLAAAGQQAAYADEAFAAAGYHHAVWKRTV